MRRTRDMQLPQLKGTPRQVTWAESIRAERLPIWEERAPDSVDIARSVCDATWWIANRYASPPKSPTEAQCAGEAPALTRAYNMDYGKTYQPVASSRRGDGQPPARIPPLHTCDERPPKRTSPARQQAAGNLTDFINTVNGANLLAHALMLAISAKLGDPSIKREAEAAVKRVEDAVAAIKDILKGTPKTLCEVFAEEESQSGGSGLPDPDSV